MFISFQFESAVYSVCISYLNLQHVAIVEEDLQKQNADVIVRTVNNSRCLCLTQYSGDQCYF